MGKVVYGMGRRAYRYKRPGQNSVFLPTNTMSVGFAPFRTLCLLFLLFFKTFAMAGLEGGLERRKDKRTSREGKHGLPLLSYIHTARGFFFKKMLFF